MLNLKHITHSWTLFLDRDGVINHEKHNDYIHTWDEFVFYDGVKEAFSVFAKKFARILIVTNQKGIGKGVTLLENVQIIHANMQSEIEAAGGRVDKVYFCPDVDENSPNRKPNAGMGLEAKNDFPEIDFTKSIMVGNTLGDMGFGRKLGMYTVFLPTTRPEVNAQDERIDLIFPTLLDFANAL